MTTHETELEARVAGGGIADAVRHITDLAEAGAAIIGYVDIHGTFRTPSPTGGDTIAGIAGIVYRSADGRLRIDGDLPETANTHNPIPLRAPSGNFDFGDADSFVRYVGDHIDTNGLTRIYQTAPLTLLAVINDHDTDEVAGHRDWQANLELTLSDRAAEWVEASKVMRPHAGFVEWLDDHIRDIAEPAAADIMEIIQWMSGSVGTNWTAAYSVRDGAKRIEWAESITATGNVRQGGQRDIPDTLTVTVPLFRHDTDPTELTARIRFRINNGALTVGVVVDDIDGHIERRMDDVVGFVQERVGREVLIRAW